MRSCVQCVTYLIVLGVTAFILGRVVPKRWFRHDQFPFHVANPQKESDLYNALGVKTWKDKLPDMSVILPGVLPSKRLPATITPEHIMMMVEETCIAEWVHLLLLLLGSVCFIIWKNVVCRIISIVYGVGNLLYIIIQRYNRPKLLRLLEIS